MSGQLGDVPPPAVASPKKQPPAPVPAPSSIPAPAAVDSKPVVEAADPTLTAPETKVELANTPTPALNPPDHGAPLPEPTSQEMPNVDEQKESQPESEHEAADSESKSQSSPTIPVEPQQSDSEKIATDQPLPEPEPEPSDADRETQGATAGEIPAVEQQIGFKEEAEKQPQSEAEPSDVKQQGHSEPVAETPEVQQEESASENATQDLSPAVESEPQNASTDTGLEKTTAPAELEIEPQSEIIQAEAAALATDDVKEDPCPEKLSDETEKPTESKEALSSETVSQEVPFELDSKTDGTATNVKEEKLVTAVALVEPSQNSQLDESQTTAAGQAPSDSLDAAISQEQADISTKSDANNEASKEKTEVAEVTKVEPGEIVQEPIITQGAMPPPADATENTTPDDKMSVHKLDGTQQEEPAKCEESESLSAASEIQHPGSGSEEEIKVHAEENKLTEKEEPLSPPSPAEKSLPVSPAEEASASEQRERQSTIENEISIEKVSVVGEIAKQEIPQGGDAETSAEMKATTAAAEERNDEKKSAEEETIEDGAIKEAGAENESSNSKAFEEDNVGSDAAAERAVEGQADKEKALEKEPTEEKTVEKANDQKSQKEEEEVKRDESGPKPCDETENSGLVIEKKESEKAGEPASAVAEPIPKDETQIQKVIETKVESDISEETEKHSSEPEGRGQKEQKQTSVDRMLNADDECENPAVTSEEKVSGKESAASEQMASGVIAETHGGDKTREEKLAQDEAAAASQECVPENHSETKEETVALTGNDEKALEEVSERKEPVKGGDEKLDEEEVASQPVASEMQTPVSLSEPNAPCDKDAAAQCGVDAESKTGEVTEAADENKCASLSVAQAPVAEPELPVSVVSEQEKGPQEENSQCPEPSGDDGADEVTVAFSSSVNKSYGSTQSVTPIVYCYGKWKCPNSKLQKHYIYLFIFIYFFTYFLNELDLCVC